MSDKPSKVVESKKLLLITGPCCLESNETTLLLLCYCTQDLGHYGTNGRALEGNYSIAQPSGCHTKPSSSLASTGLAAIA